MYSSNDIILKNISDLSGRLNLISEQKNILISMLAERTADNISHSELLNIYDQLSKNCSDFSVADKIYFCKAFSKISEKVFADAMPVLCEDLPEPQSSRSKIAFVKNIYNESAYKRFSSVIMRPTPISYSSFEDACDAVISDVCEFVILPVENSIDGKMFTFYSLLDQYDLKIYSACEIERSNDAKSIRYALAGKPNIKHTVRSLISSPLIFEFSLSVDTNSSSVDITSAAALCSARVHRGYTLPSNYNDTLRFYYSLSMSSHDTLKAFITYLCLEYPQYTHIGLYREI